MDQESEDLQGVTVLVVDDDPGVRHVVRGMLEGAGCVVGEAENGSAAIDRLTSARFDVVVTDILMPDREGIDTCMEVSARCPETGIVVMSGADSADVYFSVAAALGATIALHKPFTREQLISSVRRARNRPATSAGADDRPRPR
ncbi:MAG: response regulator [Acidobacteriota bacterium]